MDAGLPGPAFVALSASGALCQRLCQSLPPFRLLDDLPHRVHVRLHIAREQRIALELRCSRRPEYTAAQCGSRASTFSYAWRVADGSRLIADSHLLIPPNVARDPLGGSRITCPERLPVRPRSARLEGGGEHQREQTVARGGGAAVRGTAVRREVPLELHILIQVVDRSNGHRVVVR